MVGNVVGPLEGYIFELPPQNNSLIHITSSDVAGFDRSLLAEYGISTMQTDIIADPAIANLLMYRHKVENTGQFSEYEMPCALVVPGASSSHITRLGGKIVIPHYFSGIRGYQQGEQLNTSASSVIYDVTSRCKVPISQALTSVGIRYYIEDDYLCMKSPQSIEVLKHSGLKVLNLRPGQDLPSRGNMTYMG